MREIDKIQAISSQNGHSQFPINLEEELLENLQALKRGVNEQFSAERGAAINKAIDNLVIVVKDAAKNLKDDPFSFDDSILFSYSNAIMALGRAIDEELGDQPGILSSEMAISTNLVGPEISKWSQGWLDVLKWDEAQLKGASGDDVAKWQGQLSVDNAASTASSTGLNGVLSLVTQGVSSKTTTYQNLVQQANQTVTSLLSFESQLWVL